MGQMSQSQLMEKLLRYSTPSVSNVVATYPQNPHCLVLYDGWKDNWYTDQSVHCVFPEFGRRIGFAFTMVVSVPDPARPDASPLSFPDLIEALGKAKRPAIVVCQQDYPAGILQKAGLFGGQSTALFKACGVIGVVTNGPSRDIDEMRPLGVQYIMSGVTVGHGEFVIRAVDVPVSVAGMDVVPGDVIHMDEHGAVKFPEGHLGKICEQIEAFSREEAGQARALLAARTTEEIKAAWAKRV